MGSDSNIISIYDNLTGHDEILNNTARIGVQISTGPLAERGSQCDPKMRSSTISIGISNDFTIKNRLVVVYSLGISRADQSLLVVDVHVEKGVLAKKVPHP